MVKKIFFESKMPIPNDKVLYEKVKKYSEKIYDKSSAFRSGFIIQEYKRRGGTYREDGKEKNLKRWYSEQWIDIGNKEYPVFRPLIRVNSKTPLTVSEIDKEQLKKQIKLKQKIKGEKNLPKFKKK